MTVEADVAEGDGWRNPGAPIVVDAGAVIMDGGIFDELMHGYESWRALLEDGE